MKKAYRIAALIALPAATLVLFGGGRWFRREAGGTGAPFAYDPHRESTAFDGWLPPHQGRRIGSMRGRAKRWWIFCWDGASWDLLVPLLEAGRLPNLSRLIETGSAGNLYTIKPTFSPVVWTTIATGATPARHGILDFVRRPEGIRKALKRLNDRERRRLHFYSNSDRRVRAIWNVLSDRKQPVMVVGYHNTYPAERVKGVMVSSYLARRHSLEAFGHDVEPMGAMAYPPALVRRLAEFDHPLQKLTLEEMRRFADVYPDEFAVLMSRVTAHVDAEAPSIVRWQYLCRAYANDQFHAELALRLLPRVLPDLMMLHFQSVDWATHEFLEFHQPDRRVGRPRGHGGTRRYAGTVSAFYEYVDEWLGRFLAERDAETGVAVLSDHGFEHELDDEGRGQHSGAPPGILVLQGPGVVPGHRIDDATVYDIFPTLAASYGLPVSRELRGRVLADAFGPEAFDRAPPPAIASHDVSDRFQPDVALSDALEGELETDLRSLGYLQ